MAKQNRKVPFICNQGRPLIVEKQGRNEPCKCGSGKKVKQCCGVKVKYYTN